MVDFSQHRYEPEQIGRIVFFEFKTFSVPEILRVMVKAADPMHPNIPDGTYDCVTAHDGNVYVGRGHDAICRRWPVTPIREAGTIKIEAGELVSLTVIPVVKRVGADERA